MKKYTKYVNALLFLVSLGCIFMDMIKIAVWKLNGADLLKIGFGEVDRDNLLHMVLTYAQEYMEKMILLVIAVILISVVGIVMSAVLKGNVAYLAGIVFAAFDLICVCSVYVGLNSNISEIKSALSFFGAESSAKVYHFTFILWILLYAAVIVLSVLCILKKDQKAAKVKGDIYAEQFNNRKNPLKQNKKVDMQSAEVKKSGRGQQERARMQEQQMRAQQERARMQKEQQMKAQQERARMQEQQMKAQQERARMQEQQMKVQQERARMQEQQEMQRYQQASAGANAAFGGAIVGKAGLYTGKAYPLQDKYEVFFIEENFEVNLSEYEEENALAGLYYIREYQEYCVDVRQGKTVYLSSGQPLGAGREYYLPRGTKVYIKEKKNLFELA